jgi:hypothetical protein
MLHIHNGDVVAVRARRAHIPGTHLAFRESLIGGPILTPATRDEWIEARAQWLADTHGQNLLRARNDLIAQDDALIAAMKEDEVVLWFEHDLYCLIHLLYLVVHVRSHPHLTLVWSAKPLAEVTDDELRELYESREAVTPSMLTLAQDAWRAYAGADPLALNRFLANDWPDFPFLREGLTLHASRFPSTHNGLGEVANRTLAEMAFSPIDFLTLFDRFNEAVPRFGFGDADVMRELRQLARGDVALITIAEAEGGELPKAVFTLTPAGENVIAGEVDYTKLTDLDTRLGGAHLTRERMWRWDAKARQLVVVTQSPPAAS